MHNPNLIRNANILLISVLTLSVFGPAFIHIGSPVKAINSLKTPVPLTETDAGVSGVCRTGGRSISRVIDRNAQDGERGHLDWNTDNELIDGVDGFYRRPDGLFYSIEPPCEVPPKIEDHLPETPRPDSPSNPNGW